MDTANGTCETPRIPAAIGPYSLAVESGPFVFLSGQIGINPSTGDLVEGGIAEQTGQVMRNIVAILAQHGLGLAHVARCDVFLTDLHQFEGFNTSYGTWFKELTPPARLTVQVAALPRGAAVEIACIAARGPSGNTATPLCISGKTKGYTRQRQEKKS